jgi:hypothetical protein
MLFGQERSNVHYYDDTPYQAALHTETIDLGNADLGAASQVLDDMIATNLSSNDNFGAIQLVVNQNKTGRPGQC